MERSNKKIIFCSCGSECLVFEKNEDYELDIALFKHAYYAQPDSLWQRIKYAWHILRTGEPYYDSIILFEKEVYDLVNWLNSEFKSGN